MRSIRSIVIALLAAGLAVAGCGGGQPDQPTTNAAAPTGGATTVVAPTTAPPSSRPPATQPVPDGGVQSWGTGPKQADALPITDEIYNVRSACHDAYDRVVFDLNGLGRPGYLVRYVPQVHSDPSDQPIHVAGGAALQVTVQAPDFSGSGHQPGRAPWQLGQRLAGGQTTLREVRFAGSFEHVTTFALGVSSKRPFRVLVLSDSANHVTRLAVDVAR
jgi:hypothetical protein